MSLCLFLPKENALCKIQQYSSFVKKKPTVWAWIKKKERKIHSNKSQKEMVGFGLHSKAKEREKQNNIKSIYLQIMQVPSSLNKSFLLCGSFFFTSPLCDHHVTENRSGHITYYLLFQREKGGTGGKNNCESGVCVCTWHLQLYVFFNTFCSSSFSSSSI